MASVRAAVAPSLLLAAICFAASAAAAQAVDTLRIGLVVPAALDTASDAARAVDGVRFGVEEADRSARLFGRAVVLVEDGDAEPLVEDGRVQAIVGGVDGEGCERAMETASRRGVVFVNVGCADDTLRGAGCARDAFHVAASERMMADARKAAGAEGEVLLWHPSLSRFGAEQLMDRYRARFGRAMTSPAWAGWFAAKALSEASLRARSTDPARLIAYLERDDTRIDGHKGRPLSFRAWDHQLRQPLYLAAPGRDEVTEEPGAAGDETSSRDLLDTLGATAAETACRFGS
ncbi:MAG TPA: ABC transporter substrate-binding protein [Longimicrobium sp.]|nr:ABC transporter substrate-binding protein [Longimicrobium sp.]